MAKLIKAYRKLPTPTNRGRLQRYLAKHRIAACMATAEEIEFLKANDFTY